MTYTYNIAGANGNVMVPILNETGSPMTYLLYPNSAGVLREYNPELSIPVPVSEQFQRFTLQRNAQFYTQSKLFLKFFSLIIIALKGVAPPLPLLFDYFLRYIRFVNRSGMNKRSEHHDDGQFLVVKLDTNSTNFTPFLNYF